MSFIVEPNKVQGYIDSCEVYDDCECQGGWAW